MNTSDYGNETNFSQAPIIQDTQDSSTAEILHHQADGAVDPSQLNISSTMPEALKEVNMQGMSNVSLSVEYNDNTDLLSCKSEAEQTNQAILSSQPEWTENNMDADHVPEHSSFHQPCVSVPSFIGPVLPSHKTSFDQPVVDEASSKCTQGNTSFNTTNDNRYDLSISSVPKLLKSVCSEFKKPDENFLRGCKWSPDGNCVLTNSNDNCLRAFYPLMKSDPSIAGSNEELLPKVKMKECSQIYDFAWHPKMSLSHTDFCKVICTCAGIPIHMWDTETGQIVANYRAYDQFDEITAAYSVSFSVDGSQIFAGYNKAIRIFATEYPVRSCKTVKTFDSQKKDGQTGIISCFTHSPNGGGLYVAGSYSRHIGIYDSACDRLVCLVQGQHGGITHLKFSPDATKLYSGGRKDAEILCWDMRNMGRILFCALREVKTNQRIYFDLSQSGRYLVSGNQDGTVAFWDTLSPVEEINGDLFLKPCSQFQAHGDCVNGVSFSPNQDMLATASGQRHFYNFENMDSDDSGDEDVKMEEVEPWDFSLRLWQMPLSCTDSS